MSIYTTLFTIIQW